jgi:hypothetical protein
MKLFSFQQIISDVTARFRKIQTNAYKSSGKFQRVQFHFAYKERSVYAGF